MPDDDVEYLIDGDPGRHVAAGDRGLAYGDGVFETLAVIQGQPLDLDQHLDRLLRGMERLGMGGLAEAKLRSEIAGLISRPRAILKIIVTRGQGGRGYAAPRGSEPTRILSLHPWRDVSPAYAAEGINARICRTRLGLNPALAGIKHLNRLENVLARAEWGDEFQEGLMLDIEGHVIEGVSSNVFLIKGGSLSTPELTRCGVEGVMRRRILAAAAELQIPCAIRSLSLREVESADGVFFCNSLIGIWPVRCLSDRTYAVSPLVHKLNAHLKLNPLYGAGGP